MTGWSAPWTRKRGAERPGSEPTRNRPSPLAPALEQVGAAQPSSIPDLVTVNLEVGTSKLTGDQGDPSQRPPWHARCHRQGPRAEVEPGEQQCLKKLSRGRCGAPAGRECHSMAGWGGIRVSGDPTTDPYPQPPHRVISPPWRPHRGPPPPRRGPAAAPRSPTPAARADPGCLIRSPSPPGPRTPPAASATGPQPADQRPPGP